MKFKNKIKLVEETFGHEFRDSNLISRALTHRSYHRNRENEDYEKLEFLGDTIMSAIITDILMKEHPQQQEGGLTKLRSALTNNKVLSQTIHKLGLDRTVRMGVGQKINESVLADLFEAIIGAIYLDGGYHSAFFVLKKIYEDHWSLIAQETTDYKSQLQELTQSRFKSKPEYRLVNTAGPAHSREFTVAVMINGNVEGIGKSSTKKQAEHNSAKEALEKIQGKKNNS